MKKILALLFLFSFSLTYPVQAQTPTSTSKSEEILQLVEQKVKEKLDQLTQPSTPNPKKGYLGSITEITDTKIKIDTKKETLEFAFASDSVFIGSKQTKVKKTDLKVGQNVLIISLNKDAVTYAKRIIVSDPAKIENHKSVAVGKIADISTSSPVFVLIPTINKNRELQIKTTADTEIFSSTNQKLKTTDLQKGSKIICIYDNSQSPSFPALQIITQK